jgi:glycosyltransferase involved in cell wall biosynthesis
MDQKSMPIDQMKIASAVAAATQSPNGPPLVSVVIPCYNHGHFVNEAIDSVLAQTHLHHEIIVVDDGSTDRTAEVVAQYSGVRYVRQRNGGLPAARNRGIQESQGEYLVFLDADDRLLPEHLAISLDAFRSHPQAGWVCGNFRFLGSDPTWRHVHRCERMHDDYATLLRMNFIAAIHTVMCRRHAVMAVGGFDERRRANEDHDLFLRLARHFPLHCHHQTIAEYRRNAQQMSQRWEVMLKFATHTYQSQWRHVQGHKVYEEAYWQGLSQVHSHYGEKAVWQMVGHLRNGEWVKFVKVGAVLMRCYPQGVVNLVYGKVARKLFRLGKQHTP